jgi:anti-sigma factor RsiW
MERCRRSDAVNCAECEILLHALIDDELDAGHARDVEAHVASCSACAEKLQAFRVMRSAMARAKLKDVAPAALRARIEAALPPPSAQIIAPRQFLRPSRRSFFGGFGAGAVLSGALAASLMLTVFRTDPEQIIGNEAVSAHLRSLQAGHLTDVETSEQHTVKPWFNGKLDVAPPVIDLTAQGFTLVGGRLDEIGGETAAAIVYRRRQHIINLFVSRRRETDRRGEISETRHGFNVRYWTEDGLDYWAISDINGGELDEFCQKFKAALHPQSAPS